MRWLSGVAVLRLIGPALPTGAGGGDGDGEATITEPLLPAGRMGVTDCTMEGRGRDDNGVTCMVGGQR